MDVKYGHGTVSTRSFERSVSTEALGDGAPECAVEPRYPGLNIEPAEAARSVRIMIAARAIILPALGLPAD